MIQLELSTIRQRALGYRNNFSVFDLIDIFLIRKNLLFTNTVLF